MPQESILSQANHNGTTHTILVPFRPTVRERHPVGLDSLLRVAMAEIEQGDTRSSPGDNRHIPRSFEVAMERFVRTEPVSLVRYGCRKYPSKLVPGSFSGEVLIDIEVKEWRAAKSVRRAVAHTAHSFHLHHLVRHDEKLVQMDRSS